MKKLTALTLALMIALLALLPAMAEMPDNPPPPRGPIGMLALLNMSEDEYAVFNEARMLAGDLLIQEGYCVSEFIPGEKPPMPGEQPSLDGEQPPEGDGGPQARGVVYFDTLDAMLMALNAGDIGSLEIYQSVAKYLRATNDNVRLGMEYDLEKERGRFADIMFSGVLGNDFSFLMLKENAALRDEFNDAIAAMKADGTMDWLVRTQITELNEGGEISPVEMPEIAGADTVCIAVTGALPPMDYVAADGTPAGFNTAVLAEIGERTGHNIELVVVDSIGRAAALASGAVDAVFWTRTSRLFSRLAAMSKEERDANRIQIDSEMTLEEIEVMSKLNDLGDLGVYATADMPEGTIATDPYFSDVFVPVELARE